jgi:hypothetical protein
LCYDRANLFESNSTMAGRFQVQISNVTC